MRYRILPTLAIAGLASTAVYSSASDWDTVLRLDDSVSNTYYFDYSYSVAASADGDNTYVTYFGLTNSGAIDSLFFRSYSIGGGLTSQVLIRSDSDLYAPGRVVTSHNDGNGDPYIVYVEDVGGTYTPYKWENAGSPSVIADDPYTFDIKNPDIDGGRRTAYLDGRFTFFGDRTIGGTTIKGIFTNTVGSTALSNHYNAGSISYTGPLSQSNSNEVVYQKVVSTGSGDQTLLYVYTTGVGSTEIARLGGSAPGGGTFANFYNSHPSSASSQQVAFQASTSGGPGVGIYLYRSSTLSRIAYVGEVLPSPWNDWTITNLSGPSIADGGQVLYVATCQDGDFVEKDFLIYEHTNGDHEYVITPSGSYMGMNMLDIDIRPRSLTAAYGYAIFSFRATNSTEGIALAVRDTGVVQLEKTSREIRWNELAQGKLKEAFHRSLPVVIP